MPKAPVLPPLEACREQALKLLELRLHGEAELRRKLMQRRKHAMADIQAVMADLVRIGLVDDRAFARMFCESLKESGAGRLKARSKMRLKGLSEELVQETLEQYWAADGEEETDRALALARRKWRALVRSGRPLLAIRQSLARFLAGRGFSADVIGTVLYNRDFQTIKEKLHEEE